MPPPLAATASQALSKPPHKSPRFSEARAPAVPPQVPSQRMRLSGASIPPLRHRMTKQSPTAPWALTAEEELQWRQREVERADAVMTGAPDDGAGVIEAAAPRAAKAHHWLQVSSSSTPYVRNGNSANGGNANPLTNLVATKLAPLVLTLATLSSADAAPPSTGLFFVPVTRQPGGDVMVAVPALGDGLFGMLLPAKVAITGNDWVHRALGCASLLGMAGLSTHAFRAGQIDLAPTSSAHIMLILGPLVPGNLSDSHASASQHKWCSVKELAGHSCADLVRLALARLRYLSEPSPALPINLRVGVIGLQPLTPLNRPPAPPASHRARLAMCHSAEAELQQLLIATDRCDAKYADFVGRFASRLVPAPLDEIPTELLNMSAALDANRLKEEPFQHGTTIPSTKPFYRPPPPSPPAPFPQCDEDVFCEDFLCDADAKCAALLLFHNGKLERRPQPLFWGITAVQEHLRPFFAAGGAIDATGGVGNWIPLAERAPFPTHWAREWLDERLKSSVDKQMRQLWLDGIDALDDTPFLMGIVGNLYSAYGLVKPGNTASDEAQAHSDRLAEELVSFYTPKLGKPRLYTDPIPLASKAELAARGCNSRFPTVPFCATPCGDVLKSDGGIRVIINCNSPDEPTTSVDGEPVIGMNARCQLKPPEGVDPSDHRHPGEPKPSVAMAAHNDAILASVAEEAGLAVYCIALDGWKMFHQFFYATSMLAKTGAIVPLVNRLKPHEKSLGCTLALVMAMGLSPASQNCQRAMNELAMQFYVEFDKLEAPHRSGENSTISEFLDARRHLSDDFGCMARLAVLLVYTDDTKLSVVGPAARAERAIYASHLTFGEGGAAMILAEELKWLLGTHSLWLGVYSSPSLGLIWFSRHKRTKSIGRIDAAIANALTEKDYKRLISYIEYWGQTLCTHRYMISPLWRPVNTLRARGDTFLVKLKAQERGKLAYWRRTMTNVAGTTLDRFVSNQPPPRGILIEWVSVTDCRLDWVTIDGNLVWRCGLGGALYGKLWRFVVPVEFSDVFTTPLGEFVAAIAGIYFADAALPDIAKHVSEVDASATPTALITHADSARLQTAHEVFLESELCRRKAAALNVRHSWGDGNQVADAASREEVDKAEELTRSLGQVPSWAELPSSFFVYFHEVVRRIRELELPVPLTSKPRVKRPRKSTDTSPGAHNPAMAPSPRAHHSTSIGITNPAMAPSPFAHGDQPAASAAAANPPPFSDFESLSCERLRSQCERSCGCAGKAHRNATSAWRAAHGRQYAASALLLLAASPVLLPVQEQLRLQKAELSSSHAAALAQARERSTTWPAAPMPPAPPAALPSRQRGSADSQWHAQRRRLHGPGDLTEPGAAAFRFLPLKLPVVPPPPSAAPTLSVRPAAGSRKAPAASQAPPPPPPSGLRPPSVPPPNSSACGTHIGPPLRSGKRPVVMAHLAPAPSGVGVAASSSSSAVPPPPPPECAAMPTPALQRRLEQLMGFVSADPRKKFTTANLTNIRATLASYLTATTESANKGTLDKEKSAWNKYWRPYCEDYLGIDAIRNDMDAHSGRDVDGFQIECAIIAGAMPHIMKKMKPKPGSRRTHALPTSGLKVLSHVKRIHLKRLKLPFFVPLTAAVDVCSAMCKEYIATHGADAMTPERKEPLTNEIVRALLALGADGTQIGVRVVSMDTPGWASLFALFHVLAQTGFRKAEVAMPAGESWTRDRISFANVVWRIGGKIVSSPTIEQLNALTSGDYCLLRPPPSKSDPLSLHWGPNTIYLRFDATAPINAARALAHLEKVRRVPADKRRQTPLFVAFSGGPWLHRPLTDIFKQMLQLCSVEPGMICKYSMHSWRIYLACALLAAGASHATIQQLLRWRSEDALKIYARINDATYAGALAAASQASISSIRTTTLTEMMDRCGLVDGQQHAAFHDAWMQHAASATVNAADAKKLPAHDADALVAELRACRSELTALAADKDGDDEE